MIMLRRKMKSTAAWLDLVIGVLDSIDASRLGFRSFWVYFRPSLGWLIWVAEG